MMIKSPVRTHLYAYQGRKDRLLSPPSVMVHLLLNINSWTVWVKIYSKQSKHNKKLTIN